MTFQTQTKMCLNPKNNTHISNLKFPNKKRKILVGYPLVKLQIPFAHIYKLFHYISHIQIFNFVPLIQPLMVNMDFIGPIAGLPLMANVSNQIIRCRFPIGPARLVYIRPKVQLFNGKGHNRRIFFYKKPVIDLSLHVDDQNFRKLPDFIKFPFVSLLLWSRTVVFRK
jgi:hypothetical protein